MWRIASIVALVGCATLALAGSPGADPPPETPTGTLVLGLVSPERLVSVDVTSGKTVARRVPGGTLCHGEPLVVGGRVVFSDSVDDRLVAMSLGLGLEGPARKLGRADAYAAAAGQDGLWLATASYGRRRSTFSSLREVTVTGRTLLLSRRRPPGTQLLGAMDDGLLFQDRATLRVWDPRRGVETRRVRGGWLVAAHRRRAAWCRGDERCRRLHVSGRRPIELPFSGAAEGRFSPDGSLLALPIRQAWNRGRLMLVDVRTGSVQALPHATLGTYDTLTWSRDGRWLFFIDRAGRLFAYDPSAQRRVSLPFRAHDTVITMAAG